MTVLRIEFVGVLPHFICENCQWAQITNVKRRCLMCKKEFTEVRLILEDREILRPIRN